ncbi:nicotinic acid mononucleotide adenyltransferase [Ichthyenterobacterium sp. W332]|uniref:Nicotinic acid mononucleotide adenyltransferase n=1 Tax=Microcosmobacter mediterraneus TaxID=3075607 RepID=A0ABU2YIZ7_9FLAO|nr:nicotinic acid mononucleotide adenyltransferase [Ichthyenterobacterium sp. W332]MDT0558138.1 nicotinic acid mononucleotide adenyltransferase [Ichthyenterobacterium sp. W332]
MKKILCIVLVFCSVLAYSQNTESTKKDNVTIEKEGDFTKVKYHYDNGVLSQEGTFNAEGKPEGVWTSYDITGNKLAVGNYNNGKKVGKWFFWIEDTLKEVDYINSKIVNVNNWSNKTKVAVN